MSTEREKIEFILAGREDLTENQLRYLRAMGSAERVAATLAHVPTVAEAPTRAAVPPPSAIGRASTRAARLPPEQHRQVVERFGRGNNLVPHWEGNDFCLPQITQVQARAILARHAKDYGSDPRVPTRMGVEVAAAELAANAMARAKVRGE